MVVGIPGYTYVYTSYYKRASTTVLWSPALLAARGGEILEPAAGAMCETFFGVDSPLFWSQRAPLILMIQRFFRSVLSVFSDTESDMIEGPRAWKFIKYESSDIQNMADNTCFWRSFYVGDIFDSKYSSAVPNLQPRKFSSGNPPHLRLLQGTASSTGIFRGQLFNQLLMSSIC